LWLQKRKDQQTGLSAGRDALQEPGTGLVGARSQLDKGSDRGMGNRKNRAQSHRTKPNAVIQQLEITLQIQLEKFTDKK
jgi:hypothetical protein